jgi:predicted RNase H-like HicB family nuclease
MRYQLGVEDIEPDHWVAWVFELPGCFASAHTQTEAVATAPAHIAAYFRWLATYGHSMPGVDAPIQTEIVTVFHAFPKDPSRASSSTSRRASDGTSRESLACT